MSPAGQGPQKPESVFSLQNAQPFGLPEFATASDGDQRAILPEGDERTGGGAGGCGGNSGFLKGSAHLLFRRQSLKSGLKGIFREGKSLGVRSLLLPQLPPVPNLLR